jgi:hypothetical protein
MNCTRKPELCDRNALVSTGLYVGFLKEDLYTKVASQKERERWQLVTHPQRVQPQLDDSTLD